MLFPCGYWQSSSFYLASEISLGFRPHIFKHSPNMLTSHPMSVAAHETRSSDCDKWAKPKPHKVCMYVCRRSDKRRRGLSLTALGTWFFFCYAPTAAATNIWIANSVWLLISRRIKECWFLFRGSDFPLWPEGMDTTLCIPTQPPKCTTS